MEYLLAFVCGGIICIIGQLLLDIFKLTPAHVMLVSLMHGAVQ
jgi:stage V sporulation protein AE